MTYLDASVIVAILGREDDRETFLQRLATAEPPLLISPPGLFEAVISLASKKAREAGISLNAEFIALAQNSVAQFLADIGAQEIPVTPEIGRLAIETAKRYSRAVGHAAALNFGDCFAYACAKQSGALLLYKGNDFALTDLA